MASSPGRLPGIGCKVTVAGSDESCAERVRNGPHGDEIAFVTANLLAMPFADRQFDSVVSVRLISHIEDWPTLVAEPLPGRGPCRDHRLPDLRQPERAVAAHLPVKKLIERNTRTYTTF